jgi:hypothetical protein
VYFFKRLKLKGFNPKRLKPPEAMVIIKWCEGAKEDIPQSKQGAFHLLLPWVGPDRLNLYRDSTGENRTAFTGIRRRRSERHA